MKSAMMKRMFAFLLPPRQRRRVERFRCRELCWIEFIEKKYRIEGMILDLSVLGTRARPLSRFIVNRTGATVRLHLRHDTFSGVIRNSTPGGYGIEFLSPINEGDIHRYSKEYQEKKALSEVGEQGLSA